MLIGYNDTCDFTIPLSGLSAGAYIVRFTFSWVVV